MSDMKEPSLGQLVELSLCNAGRPVVERVDGKVFITPETAIAYAARKVAKERERQIKWHEDQCGAWLDQARSAHRLSQSGDEAEQQQYRQQHERYAAYAIIHRQAADAIHALT